MSSKLILLAHSPKGETQPDTFKLESQPIPKPSNGEVLIKTIYLNSLPATRQWIDTIEPHRLYQPPVKEGEVIRTMGIGNVVKSKSDRYSKGQRVVAYVDWREYKVIKEEEIMGPAAYVEGQSEYIGLTLLGINGLTAYAGALLEMKLKPEHTLLVSGAAGSVGSILVQIAKHVIGGTRVVGIASGPKCNWVKSLGADECVDYTSPCFEKDLKAALPNETDFFFDNVGGQVLDAAMKVVKRFGYISICGAMSGYNGKAHELTNWSEVFYNRYTIKGFIATDHAQDFGQATQDLCKWVQEGKLVDHATVVDTKFEDIPRTWQRLFTGDCRGTLITKLVE